jgi:5-methylcytosine-specific restriction endonuclease McrA
MRADFIRSRAPVCHWCGGVIDLRLSGRHPDGVTIDHLTPVDDAPELFWNRSLWALAHRRCNDKRGASGMMPPRRQTRDW